MADTPRDASPSLEENIAELRDEIYVNKGLLASLQEGSDTESEEARQVIRSELKTLKKRLKRLTRPSATPPQFDGAAGSIETAPARQSDMAPPAIDLASRKRQRGEFEDDNDSRASKSIRASPVPSAPESPAPSNTTYDSDDNFFYSFMSREEAKEQEEYMRNLEERRRLEEADRAFAQSLNDDVEAVSGPYASQRPRPASSSQAFFRGDGSFESARPQPALTHRPNQNLPATGSNALQRPAPLASNIDLTSHPMTPSSSEESVQEISSTQFVPHARPPVHNARPGPTMGARYPGASMPGAFPGRPPYLNTAGTSVYNAGQSIGSTSILGRMVDTIGSALDPFGAAAGYAPNVLNHFNPWMDETADPAKTQEEIRDLLKHIRPDEDLTKEQLAQMPLGLSRPLMAHQISGLAWMKKMEEGTNQGGILGDDMGLGKTLQAIALMLARPAPEDDRRPNLVVAPVALMHQWKRELEKFVRGRYRFNITIVHGPNRAKSYSSIRGFDVVLTTYGTLASELKTFKAWEERCKQAADPSTVKETCAILGTKSKFHRVFLDEAQNIKNRITKSSIAACHLRATHRWCLTGTPMQNGVEEMYSLIKFCRIRPYNNWDKFSRDIARPLKGRNEPAKERAMTQLQALLRAILLRRTKQSKIDGKPIIQLPKKHIVEDRAIFGKDQLDFYKALETKAQIQFNRYLRNGSIGRNYSNALVLLLRLRQSCDHPQLVTSAKEFEQTIQDLAPMDMVENAKLLPDAVVDRLKREETDGFECPVCMDGSENPTIFQCGHAICADCLAKLCDSALSDEEGSKPKCPHCRSPIDANKCTDFQSFLRLYCPDREGVEPIEEAADDTDVDSDSDSSTDEDESDDGADLRDFIVADDEDLEHDSDNDGPRNASKKSTKRKKKSRLRSKDKGKGKAKDKNLTLAQLRKEGLKSKSAKKKYLKRLAKDFVSSTKIDKTIELLEQIRDRGEDEKTIIFSNFTSFLDLLEVPLSRHPDLNIYSRYDGSMNAAARNDAVMDFTDKPNNKVILVSLKAGNAGLNLTAANHVIMLDPFWNPFVEYQAADRCYRIGQTKEVTVHRVLIGDEHGQHNGGEEDFTVEDRILKLQEKKKQLVETALDEHAASSISRLGTRELGYLFGVNNLD